MLNSRLIICFALLLSFFSFSFAQTPDKKNNDLRELEISLLEEVIEEAENLKLPENRALLYAQVANKIWTIDEKYARELFQNSINELITAQKIEEQEKTKYYNSNNLIYGQYPRHYILNLISARDSDLALDLLEKSRSAKLQQILANNEVKNKFRNRYNNEYNYKLNEIRLEQRLIIASSQKNTKKSIELLRKSIKTGINYETYNVLNQIFRKDPDSANILVGEIAKKLQTLNLKNNNHNINLVKNYIDRLAAPYQPNVKQLRVDDEAIRDLVKKLSTEWSNPRFQSFSMNSNSFKALERMFPNKANEFKQRTKNYRNRVQNQNPEHKEYTEIIKKNLPPEEMLRKAENLTTYKYSVIEAALNKLSSQGETDLYTKTVKNHFPENERNRRLNQFYSNQANRESSKGNFDEALILIGEITDEYRKFNSLIQLATSVYQKNPKDNKQTSLSILNQARSHLDIDQFNRSGINKYLALAGAYAIVEPDEAYSLIETIIEPINKYTRAFLVVSEFGNQGNVKKGEFIINLNNDATGQFNIGYVLQNLKRKDFERTLQLVNRFEQIETRISFKMQIVNNISNNQMQIKGTQKRRITSSLRPK